MTISKRVARGVVLRHLPRCLRTALGDTGATGEAVRSLAADARALDPALGGAVDALTDMVLGGGSDLIAEGARALEDVVSALDALAADYDRPAARDVADSFLLLLAPPDDRGAAARVVHTIWRDADRLGEVGAALESLALLAATGADDDGDEWDELAFGKLEANSEEFPVDDEARADAVRAWREACGAAYDELKLQSRMLALGLAAIVAGRRSMSYGTEGLADKALRVGQELLTPIERQVLASDRRRIARDQAKAAEAKRRREERERAKADEAKGSGAEGPEVPEGHVLVCRAAADTGRAAELVKPYKGIIGKAVPLVRTGDLAEVRSALLREYPQAEEAIGAILAGVPRPWLKLGHVLVRGDPGVGKSRFARRIAELLGVGLLRVDGANDGGASFGGTERRWYSAEPARPFMAVARFGQANPLVLVDEIDKAPTRSDYGRLWDALLGFLDPETAKRFPDPCLQSELDLSWVGVIATANQTFHLPGPLMDRFRVVVDLPKPRPEHLEALLPGVLADLASEKGLDPRFHPPLDRIEISVLRARWRGGSMRRLRRMVEAVLRARESGGATLH